MYGIKEISKGAYEIVDFNEFYKHHILGDAPVKGCEGEDVRLLPDNIYPFGDGKFGTAGCFPIQTYDLYGFFDDEEESFRRILLGFRPGVAELEAISGIEYMTHLDGIQKEVVLYRIVDDDLFARRITGKGIFGRDSDGIPRLMTAGDIYPNLDKVISTSGMFPLSQFERYDGTAATVIEIING